METFLSYCSSSLQESVPLQWEWHRLVRAPLFAPWPELEASQEDSRQEENAQSCLQWKVSSRGFPSIKLLFSSRHEEVVARWACVWNGSLPLTAGLSLMCHWTKHKAGSWMCRWRTTRCSTPERGRTSAWCVKQHLYLDLVHWCVGNDHVSMIISKFYSSLVWTSDWVFKFMSAGDDRFFSGRFIQRNHTMVRNPGLQVLYSVKNTGLSLTGSEHLKCIFCIVLYMFFHMFVCVYIYVYKSLSYIHSVLLSTYIHTWQYYTCLGLSIQIIREFIY